MRTGSPTGMSGQGLAEYSVIGSLVLLLSVPVMMMIGSNLNGFLDQLHKTSSEKVKGLKQNTAALKMSGIEIRNDSNATVFVKPSLSGQVPASPAELAARVETLGANGSTKMLADSLEATAKEQLASGEITKTQYNDLIALAEQGHALGQLERLLEDAATSTDSFNALWDTTLTWNNREVKFSELYYNIGFLSNYNLYLDPLHSQQDAYGEMKQFLSLFAKVESGGAFDNPALKSLITNLSQEIAWTGDALMFALQDMRMSTSKVNLQENIAKRLTSDLASYKASESTHQNSQGICNAGNGQDNGQACFAAEN